jgi:hypothetical protein
MMLSKKKIFTDILLAGLLFVMVLLMLMLSSCKHEPGILPVKPTDSGNTGGNNISEQSTCDPDSAYFQTQVLPILVSNCAKSGCHNAADHKEGIILDSYSNVMATGDIVPGRADQSKIYKAIIESDPDDIMPPPPAAMSNTQINMIFNWIEQGAQNNTCSDACDTNNVTFNGTIFPLMQSYCTGCHSGSSPAGQIALTNYQNISVVAQNGKLLGSVNHSTGYVPMPKGGNKLPDCRIDQIRIWIQNGNQNN